MVARLIQPDGTITHVTPKSGPRFTLTEMQTLVGGFIEVAPGSKNRVIVNEDGLALNLPPNPKGTLLWSVILNATPPQMLVGPVLVLNTSERLR